MRKFLHEIYFPLYSEGKNFQIYYIIFSIFLTLTGATWERLY